MPACTSTWKLQTVRLQFEVGRGEGGCCLPPYAFDNHLVKNAHRYNRPTVVVDDKYSDLDSLASGHAAKAHKTFFLHIVQMTNQITDLLKLSRRVSTILIQNK